MRLLHLSDLHLGKRIYNFSMLEDQKYILEEILKIADEEKITGVIIAGDVYDKPVPSAEAVALFDEFLVKLSERKLNVFVISGNHDSPERIAFGEKLMRHSHVYLSPVYRGVTEPIVLEDEYGKICVYLLPFIKPIHVRHYFEEELIEDYTQAMECAISHMNVDKKVRNILVSHQFVTGAIKSDSEEITVGGLDNVDASVFSPFDYVALGHIHRPQNVGKENIRYCGTPLKYSFSEVEQTKSVTIVEFREKGNMTISTRKLLPFRDMKKITGYFQDILGDSLTKRVQEDYVLVTLQDEQDIPNAFGKLATVYPNIMAMQYDNKRTQGTVHITHEEPGVLLSPEKLFSAFYETMNHQPLTSVQEEYVRKKIEQIWGMDDETC